MQHIDGQAVSHGYAQGVAYVYNRSQETSVPRYEIESDVVDAEHRRFHEAIKNSYRELKELEDRVLGELGEAQSAIFAAHLGLLNDRKFTGSCERAYSPRTRQCRTSLGM